MSEQVTISFSNSEKTEVSVKINLEDSKFDPSKHKRSDRVSYNTKNVK